MNKTSKHITFMMTLDYATICAHVKKWQDTLNLHKSCDAPNLYCDLKLVFKIVHTKVSYIQT